MGNMHNKVHCVVKDKKDLWEIFPVHFQCSAFQRTQENTQISAEVTLGLTTAVNGKIISNTMGEDPYILLQSSQ